MGASKSSGASRSSLAHLVAPSLVILRNLEALEVEALLVCCSVCCALCAAFHSRCWYCVCFFSGAAARAALDSDMKHITFKHAGESRAHSVAEVAAHLRAALRKAVMEGDVPKVEVHNYHHLKTCYTA